MATMQESPALRRIVSIDALRGFDMFWIMGASSLVHGIQGRNHNRFQLRNTDHVGEQCRGCASMDGSVRVQRLSAIRLMDITPSHSCTQETARA